MQDFSPRLSRGLRRDLFRQIDDHTRDGWQLFKRRQAMLDRPYRSLRDARAVYQRARTALQACSTRTRDMGTASVTEAVVLLPDRLEHPGGGREDLLRVLRVNVAMDGLQLSSHELEVGLISQHAVERLFLRMATTSTASVLIELVFGATWMSLLQQGAMGSRDPSRIRNVPVPTRSGVLLCGRDDASATFDVRTWLRRGMNARLDATVAALAAWIDEGETAAPDSPTRAARLDALIDDPAHRWIQKRHIPATDVGRDRTVEIRRALRDGVLRLYVTGMGMQNCRSTAGLRVARHFFRDNFLPNQSIRVV